MTRNFILAAMAFVLMAPMANAQQLPQGGAIQLAQAGDARCRKDVKDYLDTLRLLRETGGAQVGDMVATGIMSEAEVGRQVQAQGHCATAQLLREKQARR